MSRTTVLVTGATGFIAGHCIEELISHGYRVRGTVRDKATANVDHLKAIAKNASGELELTEAPLDYAKGWAEAAAGCVYTWPLSSRVPARLPRDEVELIRSAVNGTL